MLIGAVTGFAVTLNLGDCARRLGALGGVIGAGLAGRGVLDAVRRSRADARLQSGRDRPCAGDLRHRPLVADRRRLCRHGDPALQSGVPRLAGLRPHRRVAFGYSPLVYFALIMVLAVGWFLNRTRAGLILRAVGENDMSAHSIGYPVLANSLRRDRLRRRDGGNRRLVLLDGDHADVGRADDGGARLDRAGARRLLRAGAPGGCCSALISSGF